MYSSVIRNLRTPFAKAVTVAAAVSASLLLPQLFHAIGVLSGTGAAAGSAFLPMHLPVLLCGFLAGPFAGMIAGMLSPILSFMISGMPAAAILPFMIIELGVYGAVSGLLSRTKLNTFLSLVITQAAGRLMRSAAVLISVYAIGNTALTAAAAYTFILEGLFGVIIQWAVIPGAVKNLEVIKKYYV
jgi:hypothetical protein